MALRCPECGKRVSSKTALPGHYRRAHGSAGKAVSDAGAESAPEKRERKPIGRFSGRGMASRSSFPPTIVRSPAPASVGQTSAKRDSHSDVDLYPGDRLVGLSTPLPDAVRLQAQHHAPQAMAAKLDSGYGSEIDTHLFERGLAEHNELFDRVKAEGALPESPKNRSRYARVWP